ncbi:MAG: hypothetical protein Fur0023_17960 [Bacteroidia bacterium]
MNKEKDNFVYPDQVANVTRSDAVDRNTADNVSIYTPASIEYNDLNLRMRQSKSILGK